MAEEENNQRNVLITPEDCNAALDFWRHFNIPITPELQEAMDKFAKDPSFENQEDVKFAITGAISQTPHPAFQDEMFAKIVDECGRIFYQMQFDRDLESEVTVKEE